MQDKTYLELSIILKKSNMTTEEKMYFSFLLGRFKEIDEARDYKWKV